MASSPALGVAAVESSPPTSRRPHARRRRGRTSRARVVVLARATYATDGHDDANARARYLSRGRRGGRPERTRKKKTKNPKKIKKSTPWTTRSVGHRARRRFPSPRVGANADDDDEDDGRRARVESDRARREGRAMGAPVARVVERATNGGDITGGASSERGRVGATRDDGCVVVGRVGIRHGE